MWRILNLKETSDLLLVSVQIICIYREWNINQQNILHFNINKHYKLYVLMLDVKKTICWSWEILFTFNLLKCMHTQWTVGVVQANGLIIRTRNNELTVWSITSTTNPIVMSQKSWDELPPANTPYLNTFIIWCCYHSLPIWWKMNGSNRACVGTEFCCLSVNCWDPKTNTSVPWCRSY